jgi:threonine dehydratase
MVLIDEGHVCSKIIEIYNELGYIIEPAGVLTLCALDKLTYINGQTVVAVVSGGNSDVYRMPEILERSLLYEGRKHYFRIEFPQKAGALKNFVLNVLGDADIIYFRYTKLIAKETGPVILGVEIEDADGLKVLLSAMKKHSILFEKVDSTSIY